MTLKSTAVFCTQAPARTLAAWSAENTRIRTVPRSSGAHSREPGAGVGSERHGGGGQGSRKTDQQRDPSGDVAQGRMQGAREEQVFATGFRQASGQGAIAERTQGGENAADQPHRQDRPRRLEVSQQETAGRKDARANHVRHHQGGGAGQSEAAGAGHGGGRAGHGSFCRKGEAWTMDFSLSSLVKL